MEELKHKPLLGMRNIKSALAASVVALLYFLIDRNPTFACIGAIFATGYNMEDSKQNGGNRAFGTLFGGIIGVILFRFYLMFFPDGENRLHLIPLLFVGVVVLIMICNQFWAGGVLPGGVILCILLFNTPVETYIPYTVNRIIDSAVGVVIALIINASIPKSFSEKVERKLFGKNE